MFDNRNTERCSCCQLYKISCVPLQTSSCSGAASTLTMFFCGSGFGPKPSARVLKSDTSSQAEPPLFWPPVCYQRNSGKFYHPFHNQESWTVCPSLQEHGAPHVCSWWGTLPIKPINISILTLDLVVWTQVVSLRFQVVSEQIKHVACNFSSITTAKKSCLFSVKRITKQTLFILFMPYFLVLVTWARLIFLSEPCGSSLPFSPHLPLMAGNTPTSGDTPDARRRWMLFKNKTWVTFEQKTSLIRTRKWLVVLGFRRVVTSGLLGEGLDPKRGILRGPPTEWKQLPLKLKRVKFLDWTLQAERRTGSDAVHPV